MNLELIKELWKLLDESIRTGDISEAAETLVDYMIDEGASPSEIKSTFRGDRLIQRYLEYYLESPGDDTPETELSYEDQDDLNDIFDVYRNDDEDDDY